MEQWFQNTPTWYLKQQYCPLLYLNKIREKLIVSTSDSHLTLKIEAGENSMSNRGPLYYYKTTCKYKYESIVFSMMNVFQVSWSSIVYF